MDARVVGGRVRFRPNAQSLTLFVLAYALVARLFMLVRSWGRWTDGDTSGLLAQSERMWMGGEVPAISSFFGSGVGTPILLGFHARALGVSPLDYQLLVHPLLGLLTPLAAFVLVGRLFKDPWARGVALFLLVTAPDLLFETFRGSHGAFAHAFTFLFLAALGPLVERRGRGSAAWTVIGLLMVGGVAALNLKRALIVSTLPIGILATAAIILFLRGRVRRWRPSLGTLAPMLAVAVGLLVVNAGFGTGFDQPLERLSTWAGILFGGDDVATDPSHSASQQLESYASSVWPTPFHYIALAGWNLLVPTLAVLVLARVFAAFAWRRRPAGVPIAVVVGSILAFGLAMSLILLATLIQGELQFTYPVRIFAYLSMALGLVVGFSPRLGLPTTRPKRILAIVVVVWLALAAPLKAHSEPSLNRHWRYYEPSEAQALGWWAATSMNHTLWAGPEPEGWDHRLQRVYELHAPLAPPIHLERDSPSAWLSSSTLRQHADVLRTPLPSLDDYLVVYDNGRARFHVIAQP